MKNLTTLLSIISGIDQTVFFSGLFINFMTPKLFLLRN